MPLPQFADDHDPLGESALGEPAADEKALTAWRPLTAEEEAKIAARAPLAGAPAAKPAAGGGDVQLRVAVSRAEFERLTALAEAAGQPLPLYLAGVLRAHA